MTCLYVPRLKSAKRRAPDALTDRESEGFLFRLQLPTLSSAFAGSNRHRRLPNGPRLPLETHDAPSQPHNRGRPPLSRSTPCASKTPVDLQTRLRLARSPAWELPCAPAPLVAPSWLLRSLTFSGTPFRYSQPLTLVPGYWASRLGCGVGTPFPCL